MQVLEIPAGTDGFDCDTTVSFGAARNFVAAGKRFAVRYVPRIKSHPGDLTGEEVHDLINAGLAVMAVQHVEVETGHGWKAFKDKGQQYGAVAAGHTQACGLLMGTMVWLDLEDVAPGNPHEDTIQYCNAWYHEVARAGYTPGLYVGFNAGLSQAELYGRLAFEHYWAAYNLNSDQYPAIRGVQMRQYTQLKLSGIAYDPCNVMRDLKGGLPLACVPDEWAV